MRGRSALVTGAAGEIGAAICGELIAAGYRVIALDMPGNRAPEGAVEVEADLAAMVADAACFAWVCEYVRSRVAGTRLTVLVNNAAVQIIKDVEELSVGDVQQTLAVNVVAPFLLTQAFLSDLQQGEGSVINIASIHANLTKPGFAAYAMSKAALVGMTRALAVELGGRVRVNAICPAAIDTPMLRAGFEHAPAALSALSACHPAKRLGQPAEVAVLVRQMISDRLPFLTGSCIDLNGGIGARLHDPV